MSTSRLRSRPACLAGFLGVLLLAASIPARADDQAADKQRAEGVVVKVEPMEGGKRVRLTINTDVVWRDFARDTATAKETTPEKAAKKGDESVATKGQPKSPESLVVVEFAGEPPAALRYRGEMDERSLGATTAEAARQLAQADPAANRPEDRRAEPGKTVKPAALKPGLFVHVQYHRADDRNRADRVVVLEPVRDEPLK